MVLEDHLRKKRRLIPPVLAKLGFSFSPYSWATQIVPELFWIGCLIQKLGPRVGVEIARQVGEAASRSCKSDPVPMFATLSSFSSLSYSEAESTRKQLSDDVLKQLDGALAPVMAIWPNNPIAFLELKPNSDAKSALDTIAPLLQSMYDRRSREATLAIATAPYLGLNQGKLHISREIWERRKTVFDDIERYPETKESQSAGGFFRAMAPMFLLPGETEGALKLDPWVDRFWTEIATLGACLGNFQDIPTLPEVTEGFEGFVTVFTHFAHEDLRLRQEAWALDLNAAEGQQVILALIARQATLAIEFFSSPGIWNPNIAPIILRAMADVHITIAWLLKDLASRARMYVSDGLGAIKLEIAHRRDEIAQNPEVKTDEHVAYTEHLQAWLESQQLEFLTEVNIGSWSGKSTRVMAEEAGCKNFYNFVYQPFSSAVHSYWSHVGRINLEYCQNPAHGFHLLPVIANLKSDTHWCKLAVEYFSKSLNALDEFLGKADLPYHAYAVAMDAFKKVETAEEGS